MAVGRPALILAAGKFTRSTSSAADAQRCWFRSVVSVSRPGRRVAKVAVGELLRSEKTVTELAASIASITERSTAQADAGPAELVTAGTPGREPRSSGRLRVIHLAAYGGPYAGSFIPMLAATAREAAGRGYETTIWFSDIARGRPWLSELDDLAEIRWLESAGTNVARISSAVQALNSALVAQSGPVVLHTHFSRFDVPAALMRPRRRGLAVFWHVHSRLPDARVNKLRNTVRFAALGPLVDGILCVSPDIREQLRARHAPTRKLHDFPNAVDLQRFSPITSSMKLAARRSLGVPETARVVLHFGWDWHRKGGDLMLRAADALAAEQNLLWLTVGGEAGAEGLLGDPRDHPAVRAIGATNDVTELYAASDVLLSCSRAEGMPYAVLEALACGMPIVATDLPVQRRLLAGLPAARIVPPDPLAIAEGIRELLSLEESERTKHAAEARARIAASYSLASWARRLVDLYAEAL